MTPSEALTLLDQAVATINTDRNTHIKLGNAVVTLKNFIEPKKSETIAKPSVVPVKETTK